MVAALLLLSAGASLSGDFAATLPNHTHLFLGSPGPHTHLFNPSRTADESAGVVNVPSSDAGIVAVDLLPSPPDEPASLVDAAPWMNAAADQGGSPDGLNIAPPYHPPIS